jgi:methionyl aminopeptidase
MIQPKTPQDVETLRHAGKLLAGVLLRLKEEAKAGVSSVDLENLTRQLIAEGGAVPAFLGYTPHGADRPFPAALCFSVNDAVVHGIPNETPYILKEGDFVVLDTGLSYNGRIVDSAITIVVGGEDKTDEKGRKLLESSRRSLEAAIFACENWKKDFPQGIKTGDIGHAIEETFAYYKKTYGFNMAEYLGGHGVGFSVHEDPFIPNFGKAGQGPVLVPGTVIAIEPIVNEKSKKIYLDKDGYTIRTKDKMRSVHFEHTIVITEEGAEVLTVSS